MQENASSIALSNSVKGSKMNIVNKSAIQLFTFHLSFLLFFIFDPSSRQDLGSVLPPHTLFFFLGVIILIFT